jgi:hypothetical protein
MGTASIRRLSDRLYPVMLSLPSRKFTRLLVARVDSRVLRGVLPCIARTSWRPVPMERTSPSARSRGRLPPRVHLTENSQHSPGEDPTAWRDFCRDSSGGHRLSRDPARVRVNSSVDYCPQKTPKLPLYGPHRVLARSLSRLASHDLNSHITAQS